MRGVLRKGKGDFMDNKETKNENPKKLQNFVKYVIVKFIYDFVADCL